MISMNTYHLKFGYLYAILAAILFGLSTPAAKYLLGEISPWLLAGLLYLGSGLGLSIVIALRYLSQKIYAETPLKKQMWGWLLGATFSGGIIGPVLLMLGLTRISASTASLLLNFESVFTALIAWSIVKEHTDYKLILGMILIVAGGLILAWNGHFYFENLLGSLYIGGACLAWAIDNNLTRFISSMDPLKIVAIKSLGAGITNCALSMLFGAAIPDKIVLLTLGGVVGFIGYGISLICFILGLRHIGTARTSAAFSLAPFIGAAASILFLRDPLSWQLIMAGILMGLGIWLHLREEHSHEHQHESLTHEHKHYHDEHHQHSHQPQDPVGEPHSHLHTHPPLLHTHPHYPDFHHCHTHKH